MKEKVEISVVIPAYNEEESITPLYRELKSVLESIKKRHEIIFVDDGSTDRTFELLEKIRKKDKSVKVIQFQRNFGKSEALSAGFEMSSGEYIITMDADLQDEPSEIPNFLNNIGDYDLMVGWRYKRKDKISKKAVSRLFNYLIKLLTGVNIHDSNCGYKMYKRKVIENIELYGELHRYIPSLAYWKGFNVGEIRIKHNKREFGKSKYNTSRLLRGFLDLITVKFLISYSNRPLHLFGGMGILLTLSGLAIIAGMYLRKFIFGVLIGSRPYLFIIGILSVILGIQFISLGLLGEVIVGKLKSKKYITK